MSFRTAVRQSKALPFAAVAAAGWLALTGVRVADTMQPLWSGQSPGQTAMAGLVGVAVVAVTLGLLLVLLGELGERGPVPQTWPPEE